MSPPEVTEAPRGPSAGMDEEKAAVTAQSTQNGGPPNTSAESGLEYDENFFYPEGGVRAWTQVLASNLINQMSWGYPSAYGVYQLYYTETMGLPSSQVSWIGSIQVFLAFGICTFSGRLADAGYSRHAVAAGSFLAVLGTFVTSVCTEYWQILLAQGFCTGLGLGIMFMPGIAIVGSYFKQRRALALSVASTGTGIGACIFPATVNYLIPHVGFPWAVRCQGFLTLAIALVANVILKPRLAPRKRGPLIEWDALHEAPYLLFAAGAFLVFWALYFSMFYVCAGPTSVTLPCLADTDLSQINVFARNIIGFSSTDSVSLLLILNSMSIPSRLLSGIIADRWMGPINTLIATTAFASTMMFGWIGVHDKVGMYILTTFFGWANGMVQGVFVGSLASLTENPQKMGTRFGMVATVVGFATLAGPPTAGAIIDQSGGRFVWAQIWGGTVTALGFATLIGARVMATGMVLRTKV